jgi:segregation and condensation protein B
MDITQIESIIEGLLFASGDPVTLDKIAEIIEIDKKTIMQILNNMVIKFSNSARGVIIRQIENSYQMSTRPEHHQYVTKLFETTHSQGLSQAAYQTLAIIAYNQPVTRAKIEKFRGVNSDSALSKLIERNLVSEAGRLDLPGRPMLYRTTDNFLRSFGFSSIKDLPALELEGLYESDNDNL